MEFTILANRFLHHMVRYLVGTMVDIARGRRPLDDMRAMLAGNHDGLVTSPPAPAAGLFLRRVLLSRAHNRAQYGNPGRLHDRFRQPRERRPTSPPEPARSVPFADPALLDSDTDRPLAGSANHS